MDGAIKIFDVKKGKSILETQSGSSARVGALSWNNNLLSWSSDDNSITNRDVRCPQGASDFIFRGHSAEVCGLKWSHDGSYLASGGNDNRLFVWSLKKRAEVARLTGHTAAIKALAWSPHQRNVLASGGGTSDKTIKF